jgi:hypothetical protein
MQTVWIRFCEVANKEFVDDVSAQLNRMPLPKLGRVHALFDSSVHSRRE